MTKYRSYLDRLSFDPSLRKGVVSWYLNNIRVVLLLILTIVGFGIFSFISLERRLNPEINIPIVVVSTFLPGASPIEVEQLVTIPLENELTQADDVEILLSTSQENISTIQLQFFSGVAAGDASSQVQRLVDGVATLPADAERPTVQEIDFEAIPVWELVVSSQSPASNRSVAETIQDAAESLSSIDRVTVSGVERENILVELLPQAVEQGVQLQQLREQIRQLLTSTPVGTAANGQLVFPVTIGQPVLDVESLRALPLSIDGELVPLSEIATVQFAAQSDQSRSYFALPDEPTQQAVVLGFYKTSSADIVTAQREAAELVEQLQDDFSSEIRIETLSNTAADIDDQFSSLQSNFAQTIGLVFLTLLLFLGIRQAFMAAVAIPLAFFVAFIVMRITGQSLNFLSIFSLLIALGLLLDNAIVIISSITEYAAEKKFSAQQAGRLVWQDLFTPILTTTLTTVWAFLPLLLGTGIIGEFIKPIPIVVSTTLLASALVALGITLPVMIQLLSFSAPRRVVILLRVMALLVLAGLLWLIVSGLALGAWVFAYVLLFMLVTFWLRGALRSRIHISKAVSSRYAVLRARVARVLDTGVISMESVQQRYKMVLQKILPNKRRRWQLLGGVIGLALFSYLLVPLGLVPSEFFPSDDAQLVYLSIELPVGSRIQETERVALAVAEELRGIDELSLLTAEVGRGSMMTGGGSGANIASITLQLKDSNERQRTSQELVAQLNRRYQADERAQFSFSAPSGGPPAGSAITVKIIGDELGELGAIATEIEQYLEQVDGVSGIERSIKPGPSRLRFEPDLVRLQEMGVSVSEIGFVVRSQLSELEVKSGAIFDAENEQRMILTTGARASIDTLSGLRIPTRTDQIVTLGQLGTFRLESSPTQVTREDGTRTLTVTADVAGGYSAPMINQELFAYLDTLELPAGYRFDTGGENEENQRSVQSIIQAMLLSFVLILVTMVVQLGSFRKALLVMVVIPLAITGVFIIFALTQTALSFPALIGVLALFGIVVNNSIILIDKINQNQAIGMELEDSIVDAAGSRLRPIFFSSLTTIIGLLPITLSDPIWQGLGGAIIAGLTVSGTLMLIVIPILYYMMFAPAAVSPAAQRRRTRAA